MMIVVPITKTGCTRIWDVHMRDLGIDVAAIAVIDQVVVLSDEQARFLLNRNKKTGVCARSAFARWIGGGPEPML